MKFLKNWIVLSLVIFGVGLVAMGLDTMSPKQCKFQTGELVYNDISKAEMLVGEVLATEVNEKLDCAYRLLDPKNGEMLVPLGDESYMLPLEKKP